MSSKPINTILVTGYAKAPQGSSMYEIYKYAGMVLEINPHTHEIVDAEFTFVTDLARDYCRRLIVGYSLSNGIEPLIERIKTHYFAPSTHSVIVALKAAVTRYFEKSKSLSLDKED